ncbi:MAG: hypothetical protein AAF716_22030 [Cyanobacteria bacterium P01_D01_bin.1]
MSYGARLHKAIENTPEPVLAIVFDFLEFLKSKNTLASSERVDVCQKTKETDGDRDLSVYSDETLGNIDTDLKSLSGIFYDPAQRTISIEEMDEAIAKAISESL